MENLTSCQLVNSYRISVSHYTSPKRRQLLASPRRVTSQEDAILKYDFIFSVAQIRVFAVCQRQSIDTGTASRPLFTKYVRLHPPPRRENGTAI